MPDAVHCYAIGLRTRFRGITVREGLVWRGPAGWTEWSPFADYDGSELVPWLRAADEAADQGWPDPVRRQVEVNSIVPAVGPEEAYRLARQAGCRTAKVKVAEPGESSADDLARVEAVRDAVGPSGRVRIDANGAWTVDQAVAALRPLARLDLEYVEQPCATVEELAELRRRLARTGPAVLIAADESIRRAADPLRVAALAAADVAVLKVQPLGGVRACLQIADRIGMPVVVSSAVETSVGLRAGLALAAALPDLPYACGLNTRTLLTDDVGAPPLVSVDGVLTVQPVAAEETALRRTAAPPDRAAVWQSRLMRTRELARQATSRGGRHDG